MTVNTIMKGWEVQSTVPPLYLGECGENNALTVSIEIEEDEVISAEDFPDVEYYLDIYDDVDGETPVPHTQTMELKVIVEQHTVVDEEDNPVIDEDTGEPVTEEITRYFLQMQPTSEWLGKENLKLLQVRIRYTDNTDIDNPKWIIIKSNTFSGIVKKGIYKGE